MSKLNNESLLEGAECAKLAPEKLIVYFSRQTQTPQAKI